MSRLGMFLTTAAILLLVAAIAFPLYWTAAASLLSDERLHEGALWPDPPTLAHYASVLGERAFWRPIRNSLVVAAATTLVCVSVGSLCAYALARIPFRGRALVAGGILAVSMFPQISVVPPLYLLLRELGLIDTYPGLVLPYLTFAMPLTIWLLLGYFRQLPSDLEDAAAVDGAGRLRLLRSIVLPMAAPGIATTAILTFVYCWNEFLFALSFTTRPERHTVPVALALFRGRYQIPWGEVMAATVISTLPVLLLVVAFQRRIVRGLTAGSLKG